MKHQPEKGHKNSSKEEHNAIASTTTQHNATQCHATKCKLLRLAVLG
jgi:hypothetical protein